MTQGVIQTRKVDLNNWIKLESEVRVTHDNIMVQFKIN